MTPNQLRRTLELALKDKQPSLYAQLKASGTLDETLSKVMASAEQSISEARNQAIEAATTQGKPGFVADPTLRTQTLNSQFKAAEETALSQAIEEISSLASQPAA